MKGTATLAAYMDAGRTTAEGTKAPGQFTQTALVTTPS